MRHPSWAKKFHHHYFAREVNLIRDCKPAVMGYKKDAVNLSQWLQYFLLRIQQYKIYIIYTPVSDLHIAAFLSWKNHVQNKGDEIQGMNISINPINITTDIPTYMTTTQDDMHLKNLAIYIAKGMAVTQEWCKTRHMTILDF